MIGFWIATLNSENSKLSKLMYNIMLSELGNGQNYKWLNHIRQILISVGRAELLDQQYIYNQKSIKAKIVKTLNDLFIQDWNTKVLQSSKGRNYNIIKEDVVFEYYLKLLPKSVYISILKFRTSNHKFPIETGRWEAIPYQERTFFM